MLKCKDVVERADALVDGAPLSWRERFALRMHLLMCHHCRRYVHQLRALVTSLRRPPPETISQDQIESVLNKLDAPRTNHSGNSLWRHLARPLSLHPYHSLTDREPHLPSLRPRHNRRR